MAAYDGRTNEPLTKWEGTMHPDWHAVIDDVILNASDAALNRGDS